MVTPLKLVSFNTYLISKEFNKHRSTHPERRAAAIQQFLRGHDLCFLQEVWGSGLVELTIDSTANNIDPTSASRQSSCFDLPHRRAPFSIFGAGGTWILASLAEVMHTVYLQILQTGGLYDVAKPSVATCVYRSKHTFTNSRSRSRKGVEATLWTSIAPWLNQSDLLVINTHLDPWHSHNRQSQVDEIVHFLRTTLARIQDERPTQDWSNTGVLVVGDLNVKAIDEDKGQPSDEYETLFSSKGWTDYFFALDSTDDRCLAQTRSEQQQTYALENSLVSYPEDCGRIDYIFGIERLESLKFLRLECVSRTIVTQPRGQELSDHYPLVVELLPKI